MPALFRVVATRNDRARVTLATSLSIERARAVLLALLDTRTFLSLDIEQETTAERPILKFTHSGPPDEWDG